MNFEPEIANEVCKPIVAAYIIVSPQTFYRVAFQNYEGKNQIDICRYNRNKKDSIYHRGYRSIGFDIEFWHDFVSKVKELDAHINVLENENNPILNRFTFSSSIDRTQKQEKQKAKKSGNFIFNQ